MKDNIQKEHLLTFHRTYSNPQPKSNPKQYVRNLKYTRKKTKNCRQIGGGYGTPTILLQESFGRATIRAAI
jgi:hypothetical protein